MSCYVADADADACRFIREFMYRRCGIKLHEGKEPFLRARLGKVMRSLGMASLAEYVQFLRTRADEGHFSQMVDALTTNYSYFLRESEHFEFMVQDALPQVLGPGCRRFRVWSAAAASGEEPYTIALFLAEHYPRISGWDWQVTASDISSRALATARRGIYPLDRVAQVPPDWLRRHFQKGAGRWTGHVRVKLDLAQHVTFQRINLMGHYAHPHPFEIVFCRNMMIYLDRSAQEELIARLCRFIVPGGYLLIGHSESLNGLQAPLRCVRPSIYRRV